MKRRPYIPDQLRAFDGVMAPVDEWENARRSNAAAMEAKTLFVLCGIAFVLGVIVGPYIVSVLAWAWLGL